MTYLYFTAPWCQPCKTLGPIMDEFTGQYDIKKINVDVEPQEAMVHGVMSVPTVLAVANGQEVSRFTGARDRHFVERFFEST